MKKSKFDISKYEGNRVNTKDLRELETASGYDVLAVHKLSEETFLAVISADEEDCVDYLIVDKNGEPSSWHTCNCDNVKIKPVKFFRMKTLEELIEDGYSIKKGEGIGMVRLTARDKSTILFAIEDLGKPIMDNSDLTYPEYMVEI